ncbi:hypothetical protein DL771_009824 [Monosporascus sp. 5C6A]|nr:hypothetical protein DL771_009824 [Monosporascus sp. 5C6A]
MDSAEAEVLAIRTAHLFRAATRLLKSLFELRNSNPNGDLPQAEVDETYDKIAWLPLVYDPQFEKHEVLQATFVNICEATLNVVGGPRTDVLLNIMRMIWVVGRPRPSGSHQYLVQHELKSLFDGMYGVTMTKGTITADADDESIATLISAGPEWPTEMDDRNRPELRSCAIEWAIAAPMEFFTLSLGVPCNSAIDNGVRFGKRWRHPQPALEGELEKELPIFKNRQECPAWARMRYANLMAFIQDPPGLLMETAAKAKTQIDKVKESWALISQYLSVALSRLDQDGDETPESRSAAQSFARVFWEQVEQIEKPGVDEEAVGVLKHRAVRLFWRFVLSEYHLDFLVWVDGGLCGYNHLNRIKHLASSII